VTAIRRRLDPVVATAVVLMLVAVGFAAFAGWSWAGAPRVPGSARTRDQALQAGEQAVLNFNTLDYRDVASGLRLWEQSSTGPLHEEIVTDQAAFERQIEQAKTITTARILDAALTSLTQGSAAIIVAIQITVTPATGSTVTKQNRLQGQLTRTSSGWKLSSLSQVAVGSPSGSRG
jgi:Mce-associated membrane protein